VRAAIRAQERVLLAVTLLAGVPLGLLVGRSSWHAYAGELGVDRRAPFLPVEVLVTVVAVVAVGELISVVATRSRSRVDAPLLSGSPDASALSRAWARRAR
jgi:hypothetical protein